MTNSDQKPIELKRKSYMVTMRWIICHLSAEYRSTRMHSKYDPIIPSCNGRFASASQEK